VVHRFVVQLVYMQNEPCPDIGTGSPGDFGDVNCDGLINAVDALMILRFAASLSVPVSKGCTPLGDPPANGTGGLP
jgi:hypothetical protein